MQHKSSCQQTQSPESAEIRRNHSSLLLVTIMSQISAVNVFPFHSVSFCVNIILPSSPWLVKLALSFRFSNHNHV
jgi:hypothetical protein